MTSKFTFAAVIRGSILSALCVCLLPGITLAQQYYDPGLLRKTIDRKPVEFEPVGMRWGSFMVGAGAELVYEHNDNIFYFTNLEVADSITHVRPWFDLNSDWNRHELNFSVMADIGNYSDFDGQDFEDWAARLDGRIDVKRGSSFNYNIFAMRLHEDRSSPDDVNGIRPTEFAYDGFDVGYSHTFNRLTVDLNYDRNDTDYQNNIRLSGTIVDNQDRDRTRDALTLKLDYELANQRHVFLRVAGNNVDYDQVFDNVGFERSSNGYSLQAGMSWDLTGVLVGNAYLDYIDQEYDDPRFTNVTGFGIGGSLVWTPTQLTNISFLARNGPQETTQIGSSGYFSTLYSVRLQHELRRNWLLNVRASYTDNDYGIKGGSEELLTDTQVTRAGLGLIYLFNRNFYLSGGYVYEKQKANLSRYGYRTNRWFLTLGAEL